MKKKLVFRKDFISLRGVYNSMCTFFQRSLELWPSVIFCYFRALEVVHTSGMISLGSVTSL
jgi:hypothetical protein